MLATGMSLCAACSLSAQTGLVERRPSLDETKPVLREAAQKALQTLYGSMYSDVRLTEMEVLDMASPGWTHAPNSTNEVIYWPVRVGCVFSFKDDNGKSTSQKMGILYHVSRGEGDKCQAEFCDLFITDTLEERAAKAIASRDASRKSIAEARRLACISNLRQLDGAKAMWALDFKKTETATPTAKDLQGYLSGKRMLVCPAGGTYTIGPLSVLPSCSVEGHSLE
jgi:hypothetical protein